MATCRAGRPRCATRAGVRSARGAAPTTAARRSPPARPNRRAPPRPARGPARAGTGPPAGAGGPARCRRRPTRRPCPRRPRARTRSASARAGRPCRARRRTRRTRPPRRPASSPLRGIPVRSPGSGQGDEHGGLAEVAPQLEAAGRLAREVVARRGWAAGHRVVRVELCPRTDTVAHSAKRTERGRAASRHSRSGRGPSRGAPSGPSRVVSHERRPRLRRCERGSGKHHAAR